MGMTPCEAYAAFSLLSLGMVAIAAGLIAGTVGYAVGRWRTADKA